MSGLIVSYLAKLRPARPVRWRAASASPWLSLAGVAVGIIVLIALPVVVPNAYVLKFLATLLIWVGLAVTWNLFSGLTGYVSLGHAGFFGLGAYGAMLAAGWVGFPGALVFGMAAPAAVGLLLGGASLRLRGLQFTLASVGLAESLRLLTLLWVPVTGGASGRTLAVFPDLSAVYAITALGVVVVVVATIGTLSTRPGLRLIAIRDDEDALAACGVKVNRYKVAAFCLSVLAAGLFGAMSAFLIGFIEPQSVFTLSVSLRVVIMVLLGGIGTVWGPVIGAVVLSIVEELLWAQFPFLHEIFLGLLLGAIVLFMPQGLLGWLTDRSALRSRFIL